MEPFSVDVRLARRVLCRRVQTMVDPMPKGRRSLLRDRRGANLVEYIILVGVIALIAIAGFKIFGGKVWDKATKQGESVGNINGAAK